MTLNHHFWRGIFEKDFAPQLREMVDALERRVLPGFSDIEAEAQAHTDELWSELSQGPGTGDEDLSDLAEAARDAGVDRYMLLDGIRQGIINLFAASLYHAFEQQVMTFLRKELLHPTEESNSRLFDMQEFQKRLSDHGIEVTASKSWSAIDELRLLANTVKHAEGKSAQRLHELRPDFFRKAGFPELGEWVTRWKPRVFQPLVGKDLYVEAKDVRAYLQSLLQFWDELWEALDKLDRERAGQ
jgi:hypothetical protein